MMKQKPPEVGDILYRAHAKANWVSNGGYDWDGEWRSYGPARLENVTVAFDEYEVLSVTKHKMKIAQRWSWGIDEDTEAQVRYRDARVMFAWPTKELALDSLRIRATKRVGYVRHRLLEAEAIAAHLKELTKSPEPCPLQEELLR